MVAILLAAVLTSAVPRCPAFGLGSPWQTFAIIPLLYAGFVPPAWLSADLAAIGGG